VARKFTLAFLKTEAGSGAVLGLAAVAALIGEIGLWVGAGCLGLTLFKKRKALFDRVIGRKAPASDV